MCEFCTQHGEGKKWYLNARNYSTELLNELQRRKFVSHFYYQSIEKGNRSLSLLERIFRHQIFMPRFMRERQLGQSKIHHFGQVIPLEEINKILEKHTGQPIEKVAKDTDRDYFMGAEQAIEYGIIDQILEKRF